MSEKQGQLDTRIEVVTPENVAFQYRVAGPFRRLPAYALDVLIRTLIFACGAIGVGVIFGATGLSGIGIAIVFVMWHALDWFYGGLFETFWNGQTPGKRIMRIRVLSVDGQPIDARQAILRNLLRSVDWLPVVPWPGQALSLAMLPLYQVGLGITMFSDRFQRGGDWAAGTMVVIEERQWLVGIVRVTEPEAIRLAAFVPANFQVSRSMARTLSHYMDRRNRFAWGRRGEIARHLGEPLRQRFNLPPQTNHDMLLCAVYFRAFIADRGQLRADQLPPALTPAAQPFQTPEMRFDHIPSHLFNSGARRR